MILIPQRRSIWTCLRYKNRKDMKVKLIKLILFRLHSYLMRSKHFSLIVLLLCYCYDIIQLISDTLKPPSGYCAINSFESRKQ